MYRNEETEKSDFDEIIDEFVSIKTRKVLISMLFQHEKAGYVDVSMELRLSNTRNT